MISFGLILCMVFTARIWHSSPYFAIILLVEGVETLRLSFGGQHALSSICNWASSLLTISRRHIDTLCSKGKRIDVWFSSPDLQADLSGVRCMTHLLLEVPCGSVGSPSSNTYQQGLTAGWLDHSLTLRYSHPCGDSSVKLWTRVNSSIGLPSLWALFLCGMLSLRVLLPWVPIWRHLKKLLKFTKQHS